MAAKRSAVKMPFGLDRARKFLDETKTYGIVFDKDCDGICSAALVVKYLRSRGVEPLLAHSKDETGINVSSELLGRMNELETLITCDLPMDQSPAMDQLNVKRILVIDHHTPVRDLNSQRVVHINPRFEDPQIYRPTSYLAHVLTQPFSSQHVWISGVGVLADYGLKDCKDLMGLVAKGYPQLVTENYTDQKEMWNSGLGMIANIISAAYGVKSYEGSTRAFQIVSAAERPEDVTSSELMQHYDEFQSELEHLIDDFEHNAQHHAQVNAYTYQVNSKYKIMSVLATLVSEKRPDAVVFLYRETSHHIEVSTRCQSGRVDVAKLMQELTRGVGSGGGHPKAAGGEVTIEHKEEFYERMRRKFEGL